MMRDNYVIFSGQPIVKRQSPPPTKTIKAYKQVCFDMYSNKVYPLYVDAKAELEIGVWYDAGCGDYFIEVDPKTEEWISIPKVKSKLGNLAYRPGFHLCNIPYAPHIYTKKPNFKDEKWMRLLQDKYDYSQTRWLKDDTAWVECEITFDVDYNPEAYQQGICTNSQGKEVNSPSHSFLRHIPINGTYQYRTNSQAPDWMNWYITGSMKINRILTDEEVEAICKEHGVNALQRQPIMKECFEKFLLNFL